MELDTGAAHSIIPERVQKKILPNIEIHPPDVGLSAIGGLQLPILEKCYINVFHNKQHLKSVPLYIVKLKSPALFGRDWFRHIGLDWSSIHQVKCEKGSYRMLFRSIEAFLKKS